MEAVQLFNYKVDGPSFLTSNSKHLIEKIPYEYHNLLQDYFKGFTAFFSYIGIIRY